MSALHFSDVTSANTPAGHLAREGVTCTVCHQTTAQGLGTPESYLGNFVLNDRREIYGPHPNPTTMPMQNQVMYTPTAADHMTSAAFCASCHTVITRPLNAMGEVVGPEFNEQVTYLEWRNSDFRTEAPRGTSALSCQGCHMSTRDPNGMNISTRLSVVPPTLMPRTPIGRHTFVGANAYMLSLLAAERDWVGSASTPEELTVGAQNAEAQLRRAATLTVESAARMGDALTFNVRVSNTTGHRFPTGYPSRRAWLHVRVLDGAGAVRFEVGRTNALGRFVNGAGTLLEAQRDVVRPHLRTITADDQIQVWESVMVDVEGRVTHLPLRAARYIKDNRILSRGWRADHADAARTSAVGVEGDTDFRAGEDLVRFSLTTPGWTAARVEAELLFQSISPDALLAAGQRSLPAGARLRAMVDAHPPVPRVAATANATVR
jgi:mono/diheme cytochrome c family protein